MAVFINPTDLLVLSNQSMASSFTSNPILLTNLLTFTFKFAYTGTPTGIFSIQFSADSALSPLTIPPTLWIPYAASNITVSGAAGNGSIDWVNERVPSNWVQFVWTSTSGSGTLTSLRFNGK